MVLGSLYKLTLYRSAPEGKVFTHSTARGAKWGGAGRGGASYGVSSPRLRATKWASQISKIR